MTARLLSTIGCLLAAALVIPARGRAQDPRIPPSMDYADLAGPRAGITMLPPELVDTLKARGIDVGPVISQVGWQFERIFYRSETGFSVMAEWVLLVGGLDRGAFLPSTSWLTGIRLKNGFEFGLGPNVSAGGLGLALATGVTTRIGPINVPINLAVVPSDLGIRSSVLVGLTMRSFGSNWW